MPHAEEEPEQEQRGEVRGRTEHSGVPSPWGAAAIGGGNVGTLRGARPRGQASPVRRQSRHGGAALSCHAVDFVPFRENARRRDGKGWMKNQDEFPGFAPEIDAPIPYMKRICDYYAGLGYAPPYRWAHYAEVPFRRLVEAARRLPRGVDHDRRTLPRRSSATRAPARRTTLAPNSIPSTPATAPSITICASRTLPMTARTRRRKNRTPGFRWRNCGGSPRVGTARRRGAALSRHADQPQSAGHDRSGLPGSGRALPRRRRRRRHSRRQLTGLPPDRESGRPAAGGERHRRRRHGLRQGHRRILRRAAFSVQRFSARQRRRAAA